MKLEHSASGLLKANSRLTVVTVALGVSIVTNLVLSAVAFGGRQTLLVPVLPNAVALSPTEGASEDYLEALGRDTAYLFLNRTPDNEGFFNQQILKIADAQTYQVIRDSLIDTAKKIGAEHLSQTFIANDYYVDPRKLYVEVAGTLLTYNGMSQPQTAQKVYAMRFIKHGAMLRLYAFEEIDPRDAAGAKLPLTPAPPPRTAPISAEVAP